MGAAKEIPSHSRTGGDHADNIPILESSRLFVIITAVYYLYVARSHVKYSQYSVVACTVRYTVRCCTARCSALYRPWPPFCIIEKQQKNKELSEHHQKKKKKKKKKKTPKKKKKKKKKKKS